MGHGSHKLIVLNSWTSEGDDVERPAGVWLVEVSHWVTGNEEIFLPHFLFWLHFLISQYMSKQPHPPATAAANMAPTSMSFLP